MRFSYSGPLLPGRPAPELAAVFLPRHAPPGSYQLTVLDQPIETARTRLMKDLDPAARENDPPGAWTVKQVDPAQAFGEGGIYSVSRLARLFTGRPALQVRAPIRRAGRVIASLTLISPVPDAALTHLSHGQTMAILFAAEPATRGR